MQVSALVSPTGNSVTPWIIDYGASHHMTSDASSLVSVVNSVPFHFRRNVSDLT